VVRHYIPKKKAHQYYFWDTQHTSPEGVYVPTYNEKIRDTPEPEVLTYIRDQDGQLHEPKSREEWRVSQALRYFSQPFYYQYVIGMQGVRGSQSIDFYVDTAPTPTLIWVQGLHWHTGAMGEERTLLISQAETYFDYKVRSVEIWDYEVPTVEDAIHRVKERVI
jgi:hypothetical protein